MSNNDERDYLEENYWRNFCPACGSSPCFGEEQGSCEAPDAGEAASMKDRCVFCGSIAGPECPVCYEPICWACWEAHTRVRCPQSKSEFATKQEYEQFHIRWPKAPGNYGFQAGAR